MLLVVLAAGCGRIGFDDSTAVPGGEPFASCETLASTCGPAGASPCCESPAVPGGTFLRSYDGTPELGNSANPATVSTFRLDKYEVTVGRFRAFLVAGMGTQRNPPVPGSGARTLNGQPNQGGWDPAGNAYLPLVSLALITQLECDPNLQTWTDEPGANENRPINCVTWYEAMAFCIWDGGFLPTEAEWNYAASGGDEQRVYPWSSPPSSQAIDDSTYASYYVDTTKQCMGDGMMGCTRADLVPVGSKPAGDGAWGHADLGGNVSEWVLDGYAGTYITPCTDCANLAPSGQRVVRGGSFRDGGLLMRAGSRAPEAPIPMLARLLTLGIRCARTP